MVAPAKPPSARKCEVISRKDTQCKCWATHVVEMPDGKVMRICGVHRHSLKKKGIQFQIISWMGTESR